MPIILVGNRDGEPAIHWRGVFLFLVIVTLLGLAVILLFNAVVGFGFTLRPFPIIVFPMMLIAPAAGMRRALKRPAASLPPIS